MDSYRNLPDWPRAHGGAVVHGQIRVRNSDFEVSEDLGFEFSGAGEHDFLRVRKDGANTQWVADRLAQHAGVRATDVGFAGLKDRHALTTQWFSVPAPGRESADWGAFAAPGVEILEQHRHDRKLRRGAHRGNQFRLCLRADKIDHEVVAAQLQRIGQLGVPNYFGEQRFGRMAGNLDSALELFSGKRLKRRVKGMALSAARSFLFNEILGERVRNQTWDQLLPGDCASLAGSASFFAVAEPDAALLKRCREFDIHPSAALWGRGQPATAGDVTALEASVCERHASLAAGLEEHGLTQGRRATRLMPVGLQWEFVDDGVWLNFYLESGAFATTVLRELADFADAMAEIQRPRNST